MDEIALAAGVGKPTLYRRFGDRAGLVRALLQTRETALQEADPARPAAARARARPRPSAWPRS